MLIGGALVVLTVSVVADALGSLVVASPSCSELSYPRKGGFTLSRKLPSNGFPFRKLKQSYLVILLILSEKKNPIFLSKRKKYLLVPSEQPTCVEEYVHDLILLTIASRLSFS